MKKLLTLLLFCSISVFAAAQEKVSSISKTILLQSESISKLKVDDEKRVHLVDNEGSYTGEYMILSYQDNEVKEYTYYGASGLRKGKVKHYSNGEILTVDLLGKLIQKENISKESKK